MTPDQLPPLRGRATVATVVIVIVLIALCLVLWMYRNTPPISTFLGSGQATQSKGQPKATVAYSCDQGKTLVAQYFDDTSGTTGENGEPLPGGYVVLTLTDGSMMTLPQTMSGSGTRYANQGESFIFWSKGNTAFVEEGADQTQTYTGCIAIADKHDGEQDWKAFASSKFGVSVLYPPTYSVNTNYTYQALGPGKNIAGVKFTIPATMTQGTNLGSDSGVSVEVQPKATDCSANIFLDNAKAATSMTDGDTTYSVASTTDAGAGNRYEEVVYAIPGTVPCTAVRYFVHYSVLENYPAGTVQAFDHAALTAQFDQIRRSLVLGR